MPHMWSYHHLCSASSLPPALTPSPSTCAHTNTNTHKLQISFPPIEFQTSDGGVCPIQPWFLLPSTPNYRHVGKVVCTIFWYLLAYIIKSTYQLSEFQNSDACLATAHPIPSLWEQFLFLSSSLLTKTLLYQSTEYWTVWVVYWQKSHMDMMWLELGPLRVRIFMLGSVSMNLKQEV